MTLLSVNSIIILQVSKKHFESKDTYSQLFINGRVETILIKLNTKFDADIIHVPGETFFSSDIIDIFEREKLQSILNQKKD